MTQLLPKKSTHTLFLTGPLVSLLIYGYLAFAGDIRFQMATALSMLAIVFVIYLSTLRYASAGIKRSQWLIVIVAAVLARLIFITTDPVLSDDAWRYLWDGHVFSSGINPYTFPPRDAALQVLRDTEIYPRVSHPEIPAVYAPLAQSLFALNALLGNTLVGWRIILLLIEALFVVILLRLLQHFKLPRHRLLIWLLNPLVIIETYYSAHLEMIAVMLFFSGIWLFLARRSIRSAVVFAAAALIKFTPLVFTVPFLKQHKWRNGFIIFSLFILGLAPFSLDGTIPMAGFISFANRWEFNGAIYKTVTVLIDSFDWKHEALFQYFYNGHLEQFYLNGAQIYKLFAFVALLAVVGDQFRKLTPTSRFESVAYLRASMVICAAMLLLSPTLYPWYVLWMIPFMMFIPNVSWLLFSGLIMLSYWVQQGYAENGVWQEQWWVMLAEYLPFYFLLIREYSDKHRITGWWGRHFDLTQREVDQSRGEQT